jgi:hypothetical protein
MPVKETQPQTSESLEKTASQLDELSANLRVIASKMKGDGFDVLQIANYKQLVLALKNLNSYSAAAHDALTDAREQRGDFVAKNGVPESKGKRPAK